MKSSELWPGMPRSAHRRLARYVEARQSDLRLDHWTLTLEEEPCSEGSNAVTWLAHYHHTAKIYLAEDFATRPRDSQRITLLHELLHLHFAGLGYPLGRESEARKIIGSSLADVIGDQIIHAVEHGVDDVAKAIAPFFPIP